MCECVVKDKITKTYKTEDLPDSYSDSNYDDESF